MKRFVKLLSLSLQSHIYYRTSFFINLLTPVINLAGQFLLWQALYRQQDGAPIGGMAREEMFAYLLAAFAIGNLLNWSTENTLSKEIRSGTIVARIIRPASFLLQYVSEMLGALIPQGIMNFVIAAAGFLFMRGYLRTPDIRCVLLFVPCLALAVLLRMLLIDIFSLLCFFTTGHLGIAWTRTALFDFFSGALIPVAMFPQWLKTIAYATPFPYMMQIPIAVLLGQELPVPLTAVFGIQGGWLALFLLMHAAIYGRIRKNLSIAGG